MRVDEWEEIAHRELRRHPIRFCDLSPEQRARVLRKYNYLGIALPKAAKGRWGAIYDARQRLRNYITGQEDQR